MMELDIKRGHYASYNGDVKGLMKDIFGEVDEEDGWLVSSYGAMQPIKVKVVSKTKIDVDIITEKDVDEATAIDTLRAKNKFLEAATGYNSKQRGKKLQEKAKKGLN